MHDVLHPVEAAILIDDFHNSHRPHQEKERCGCVTEMLGNQSIHERHNLISSALETGMHQLCERYRIEHVKSPAEYKHQQGDCSLVDLRQALHRNEGIAQDEDDDNSNC